VSQGIWDEILSISEIEFRFKEKEQPSSYASFLSKRFNTEGVLEADLLDAPSRWKYDEGTLKNYAERLEAPEGAVVSISSQDFLSPAGLARIEVLLEDTEP